MTARLLFVGSHSEFIDLTAYVSRRSFLTRKISLHVVLKMGHELDYVCLIRSRLLALVCPDSNRLE